MDSFSLPTLPLIAIYDTHNAATCPSTPRRKNRDHSNAGNSTFCFLQIDIYCAVGT